MMSGDMPNRAITHDIDTVSECEYENVCAYEREHEYDNDCSCESDNARECSQRTDNGQNVNMRTRIQ